MAIDAEGELDGKGKASSKGKGRSDAAPFQAVSKAVPKEPTPTTPAPAPSPPAWMSDDVPDEELPKAISDCKSRGIELEINALAARISPTDDYKRACQKCIALLRSAVSAQWGSKKGVAPPLLEVCGAVAQGTEVDGSEVDVSLRLAPGITAESKEQCIKELRERLEEPPSGMLVEVSDPTHVYPHTASSLTVELRGTQPKTFCHLLMADQQDDASHRPLTVDIVIKQLCDTHAMARDLVRLVKLWAHNHGLANQQDGFINGVAWTLLALFVMQKMKLVPPFSAIARGPVQHSTEKPDLAVLLRHFFEFLAGRGTALQRGLSVVHAQEYRTNNGLFFIEDPAEFHETRQQRNLAETLGQAQWARILEEARKSSDKLNAKPQRWFHWAETFDPRSVPSDKLTRLQPLREKAARLNSPNPGPVAEPKRSAAPATVGTVGKAPGPHGGPIGKAGKASLPMYG